jgi:hypothetical protein
VRSGKLTKATIGIVLVAGVSAACSLFEGDRIDVPEGTSLLVTLETPLRTDANLAGDAFMAIVADAVEVDGEIAVPEGTRVYGNVTLATPGSYGTARMILEFRELGLRDGTRMRIDTRPLELVAATEGSEEGEETAREVEGPPLIRRAVIGALPQPAVQEGSANATPGAALGTIVVLSSEGEEIHLEPGREIAVQLERRAEIPLVD